MVGVFFGGVPGSAAGARVVPLLSMASRNTNEPVVRRRVSSSTDRSLPNEGRKSPGVVMSSSPTYNEHNEKVGGEEGGRMYGSDDNNNNGGKPRSRRRDSEGEKTQQQQERHGEGNDDVEYEEEEPIPPCPRDYLCSITKELMRDPVVAADGHSYERQAIEHWLRSSGKLRSPVTNEELRHRQVVPNHSLNTLIEVRQVVVFSFYL